MSGILFVGCPTATRETTYTIWTWRLPYSDYETHYAPLEDNHYSWRELPDIKFNKIQKFDNTKYNLSELQIYSLFIGQGFGSPEANKVKSDIITKKHLWLVNRVGNTVYFLLK